MPLVLSAIVLKKFEMSVAPSSSLSMNMKVAI
jgi:hypothetical protein